MKEVLKAEVIKLLDTGMIYPISDSPWVSPIQVRNEGWLWFKMKKKIDPY